MLGPDIGEQPAFGVGRRGIDRVDVDAPHPFDPDLGGGRRQSAPFRFDHDGRPGRPGLDSAQIAVSKSAGRSQGSVAASDAFFPFRDGVDVLAKAGIRAVIQPGGSRGDEEVIAACNEHDIAMIFTARRHFRH